MGNHYQEGKGLMPVFIIGSKTEKARKLPPSFPDCIRLCKVPVDITEKQIKKHVISRPDYRIMSKTIDTLARNLSYT